MDKVTKNILEVTNAKNAIERLLDQTGLNPKDTYWLGRNHSNLAKAIRTEWNPRAREVFMRFAVDERPDDPTSDKIMPKNMNTDYQRALAIKAETINVEVEVQILEQTPKLEHVMSNISGHDQLALSWMLKECSALAIPGGIQIVR